MGVSRTDEQTDERMDSRAGDQGGAQTGLQRGRPSAPLSSLPATWLGASHVPSLNLSLPLQRFIAMVTLWTSGDTHR